MKWVIDDAGDLINLDHIQAIILSPISPEQEAPAGHTHELLAVNADQESYRLYSGDEEHCIKQRTVLANKLEAVTHV